MKHYPSTYLPPYRTIAGAMDAKYADVARGPAIVTAALNHLRRLAGQQDNNDNVAKATAAWIDILSTEDDPRYGVLVWHLVNSNRRYGTEPWVIVLNYANGTRPIPMKEGPE